jgi:uncharacterized small protein (DUF1192 family)
MKHTPVEVSGRQRRYAFPNGYGASVINDGYGSEQGHFELAVLKGDHLTYETPITDDVLGWLTAAEVEQKLDEIAALTPESVIRSQIERERIKRDERIAELRAELARLEAEEVSR